MTYAPQRNQRNTNLELFRIITMFLIVAHHYVVNSTLTAPGGAIYSSPLASASLILQLFGAWGKTGINCFVLITGYFMCKSEITLRKFAKLLFEIMFYRISIYFIFCIAGIQAFSAAGFIKILIPVQTVGTGFTSAYLVFYLLIPFINILLKNMNRIQHLLLLALLSFTYVFLGTFRFAFSVNMNYVSWFTVVYLFAAYVRMYPEKIFERTGFWGVMSLVSVLLSSLSVIVCAWLSVKTGKFLTFYFVSDSNTFLALSTAFCLFMFFKNLNIRHIPFVNTVAASCFGVLLIHANSDAMRRWLWVDTLKVPSFYAKALMPLHAVGSVLLVYAACTCIDWIRIRYLEKPFFRLWDRKVPEIAKKISK